MWSPHAGPPPDNLVPAVNKSKLLVQTSAGHLMQEAEEQGDAEKDGDFSYLEHEEACDDELADFEAMRGLGAARPRRVGPSRSTNSAPAQKNSRKLESDLNEVASGTRTPIQQLGTRAMQPPKDLESRCGRADR